MSEGKTVETTLPQTRQGKVQMHSLDVGVKGGEEITLRANDTRYSSVLRLDATGNTQKIVLAVPERGTLRTRTQKQYELGVKVTYNTGVYARTRLVQILPNMLFLNVFGFPLEYVQDNLNDPAVTITPMKTMPFHWPAKRDVQLLRIRAKVPIPNSSDESGRNDVWNWSEPFALVPQQLTHFTVKLRGNRNRELVGYIPVSVTWVKAGHVVLFGRPYGKEPTNYVIRNNTALRLEYWQDGVEKETLSPHSEVVYGFDRLLGPQFINVQVSNDDLTARSYDMNSLINKFSPVEYLRVFQLVAMNDSVLEVCKTRDGQATIRLWPKRDRTAMEYRYQMWSLTANGTLVNPASGLIAQVYGDGLYPGARLYMNDPQRRATEQWQLLPMVPNISSARQTNLVWELDADDLKSGCFLKLAPRNPQSQLQNFRPVYLTQGTGVLAPRIDVDGPTRILEFSDGRPLSEGRRVAHGVSRASFRSLPGMASMGLLGSGGEGSEVAMATTDGDLDGDVSRSDLAVR
ncbi:hypothetical protein SARC_10265 [Sphaeroforma arctica JP610]|uniref:Vacuolar protein sorting-associated protein 13 VPS13 adaptor binding domain-containing protein n=1 Tax=Sphaeroforma arctica JP610 TaxID=667725 RepID=A0A0L0FKG5_9EUKA|nr:hypothetical protein SARC_10265 [Sphaeroforma arctica JP610]KNC77269.1 hypothetical protein SARC_10265 [Sphaeroforma arctica JP610]|eukprot:XP_014151171.1 hypothetical protein SARC_10265 [Sphaeroforma arctica JP610]